MLIKEIFEYFKTKNKHYPISDGFVKSGYQQNGGEYINKAKNMIEKYFIGNLR